MPTSTDLEQTGRDANILNNHFYGEPSLLNESEYGRLGKLILKLIQEGSGGTTIKYGGRVDSVNDLPEAGEPNQFYLVGLEDSENFDEYLWAEVEGGTGHWDRLGSVSIIIDDHLDPNSANPVQNGIITAALTAVNNAISAVNTNLSAVANAKYDKESDVQLSQAEYDAIGVEKYTDDKNYYIYDADDSDSDRAVIYGFHIDPNEADPKEAVTYLDDAVGKTPAAMGASAFSYGGWSDAFFMPKPCMLRSDGTVAYYLDPDDYTKKADGTASDVANASFDGNAMMEWPLIWYKFEAGTADGEVTFHCSNKKIDETYNCWCNYDANDNIIPHFYTAIYNGTGTEKMRSLSGIQLTPANGNGLTTGQQEVTRATANNTTSDVEWYTNVYSDRQLISALLILMSKCTNDQAAYGRGLDTGSQSVAESYITGTLNDKGLFYGVTANGNSAVKVFGMENWFGCKWRRTAGLIGGTNNTCLYKLTYGTADGSTAKGYNSNGQGYLTANGISRPTNNYVTKMGAGKHGLLPKETAAVSSSLYYGVYYYGGTGYALFGGYSGYGLSVGSLDVSLGHGSSRSNWTIGASLSCKPTKKT